MLTFLTSLGLSASVSGVGRIRRFCLCPWNERRKLDSQDPREAYAHNGAKSIDTTTVSEMEGTIIAGIFPHGSSVKWQEVDGEV